MAMRTSLTLLPPVGPVMNFIGEPVRGAGYRKNAQRRHDIAIRLANFRGRIIIEGSLYSEPTSDQWAAVWIDGKRFLDFPRETHIPSSTTLTLGETITLGYFFVGAYVWLRARVDRSFVAPPWATEEHLAHYGRVDSILLNY